MTLLKDAGVPTPKFGVATTAAEAKTIAEELGGSDLVIKAQVSVNFEPNHFNINRLTDYNSVQIEVILNNLLILKVLAGGRGKGHFAKYPKGGVQLLYNTDEIEEAAKGMIGKNQYLLWYDLNKTGVIN